MLNVFDEAPKLLKFLGLPLLGQTLDFLKEHTTKNESSVHSTYRDVNATVFHWTKDMPFDDVQVVQQNCYAAMKVWGYIAASTERELRNNFYPINQFSFE